MALKSTVYKVSLNVADMDRHVYQDFNLRVAKHPSETDARMMLRIVAFALHADEHMEFGKGISTDDEPDLWQKSLTGDIETWIELGTPDESRLRKACGRAQKVILYSYGDRSAPIWWEKSRGPLERFENLEVYQISDETCSQLAQLAAAAINLQISIQDGEAYITAGGDNGDTVQVKPVQLR